MMKPFLLTIGAMLISTFLSNAWSQETPLRLGVVGLTHTHVHWILGRPDRGDIELVGIAEPNRALAMRFLAQHHLDTALWYPSMAAMIKATEPEAVCAFNSIYEHLEVVEYCAPLGIHVMVEKPLAVSLKHAQKMEALSIKHNIHLLTNYETTWYSSHYKAYDIINQQNIIGPIRKVVIHDGHQGPIEIGCNQEFLDWLTDPVMNGGGAITDFGCYGANLMTWLMKGARPLTVSAVTQQIKPHLYPKVDDEATIILTYPSAQAIIQASWNWPLSRKDIAVYGVSGYLKADREPQIVVRKSENLPEETLAIDPLTSPYDDPFAYFSGVIKGKIKSTNDLSSLKINMIVMEILEAAKQSAKKGKVIRLP